MITGPLSENPAAFPARSIPVPLQVRFAKQDGELQTLEGVVRYKAGDAIITGVQGEQWPVERERFMATYEPVGATQPNEDGVYAKKPRTVWALELKRPIEIELSNGRGKLAGKEGDYLVEYSPGDLAVVAPDIFAKTYRPDSEHIVRQLLNYGRDADFIDPTFIKGEVRGSVTNDPETLKMLLNASSLAGRRHYGDDYKPRPLQMYHSTNDPEILNQAFLDACRFAEAGVAEDILKRGAKPDVQEALFLACGVEEVSPLFLMGSSSPSSGLQQHEQLNQSRAQLAKLVLDLGADPNQPGPSGDFPIHQAARWNYPALIDVLCKAGVDPNVRNKNGDTALHIACTKNNKEAVEQLTKMGVDPTVRNNDGATPLRYANDPGIRQILAEYCLEWKISKGHEASVQDTAQHHTVASGPGLRM